ncbi:MAG: VOC family protein [Rhizobiales bacterium]|mgnify:FL=1|nr:VOC family protein [Hyphomicrobiales bacterium]
MRGLTPSPNLTVVTLGVGDVARSAAFYERLGLTRRFRAAGDEVAFFEAGGVVLGLFGWDALAEDAALAEHPRPLAFRGTTLAWNCNAPAEVDAVMAHALSVGATLLRVAGATSYGGYRGYFADPDGHAWEVVQAPGIVVTADGRLDLPD